MNTKYLFTLALGLATTLTATDLQTLVTEEVSVVSPLIASAQTTEEVTTQATPFIEATTAAIVATVITKENEDKNTTDLQAAITETVETAETVEITSTISTIVTVAAREISLDDAQKLTGDATLVEGSSFEHDGQQYIITISIVVSNAQDSLIEASQQ